MTLSVAALEVRYGSHVAVRPASFELPRGHLVGLIGPNGAGKSSLLRALAGVGAHTGRVTWCGQDLRDLTPRQHAKIVAYLPQTATVHWPMRVRDLVALGRLPHRNYGSEPSSADAEAIDWAIGQAELAPFADRAADRLSVGERARVLLARALAVRAPILLVDEPIAMLDPYHQLQIMSVLRSYAAAPAANGRPDAPQPLVIAVLHDLALAARFCDRVLLVDTGTLVADGNPETVMSSEEIERRYHVEPFITRYADEPLIVPWRRLEP
jgi:iron complex transport system ATP-binding protein